MYAHAHGRDPEAMLEYDKTRWPGGKMCGFILWIQSAWSDWKKKHDYKLDQPVVDPRLHADFDDWLKRRHGYA